MRNNINKRVSTGSKATADGAWANSVNSSNNVSKESSLAVDSQESRDARERERDRDGSRRGSKKKLGIQPKPRASNPNGNAELEEEDDYAPLDFIDEAIMAYRTNLLFRY